MKKALLYLFGFGVFIFLYITLKQLGFIGRQFSAGTNTRVQFTVSQLGQSFEVPINVNARGIYRYSAIMGLEEDAISENEVQVIELNFTEELCETNEVFGTSSLKLELRHSSTKLSGHGRYGAIAKAPLLNRGRQVCLKVVVSNLSKPLKDGHNLTVWAGNTRPCWGIECMLD